MSALHDQDNQQQQQQQKAHQNINGPSAYLTRSGKTKEKKSV